MDITIYRLYMEPSSCIGKVPREHITRTKTLSVQLCSTYKAPKISCPIEAHPI